MKKYLLAIVLVVVLVVPVMAQEAATGRGSYYEPWVTNAWMVGDGVHPTAVRVDVWTPLTDAAYKVTVKVINVNGKLVQKVTTGWFTWNNKNTIPVELMLDRRLEGLEYYIQATVLWGFPSNP